MQIELEYQLVATYYLRQLEGQAAGGETIRLRLDVLRDMITGQFRPRVWRVETYELLPSFPLPSGESGERVQEQIAVRDEFLNVVVDDIVSETVDGLVAMVLTKVRETFGFPGK